MADAHRSEETEITEAEPFFVQRTARGWGVFCMADDTGEPDEVTDCLEEPFDEQTATAMCALLNAAYGAGFEAGANS